MFELRVLSGLHQGAIFPLWGEMWMIGHGDDVDLQLTDPGIAQYHAQLQHQSQHWQLLWVDASVQERNHDASLAVYVGEPFMLEQVWLYIEQSGEPWPRKEHWPLSRTTPEARPRTSLPYGMFWWGGLTLLLLFLLWLVPAQRVRQPIVGQDRPLLESSASVQQQLRQQLQQRGLLGQVLMQPLPDRVLLQGELSAEQLATLERLLMVFHQRYQVALPIQNATRLLVARLPFNIVQITSGPQANIVTDNGQRLFVGDELAQLRLMAITGEHIEFNGRSQIKVQW